MASLQLVRPMPSSSLSLMSLSSYITRKRKPPMLTLALTLYIHSPLTQERCRPQFFPRAHEKRAAKFASKSRRLTMVSGFGLLLDFKGRLPRCTSTVLLPLSLACVQALRCPDWDSLGDGGTVLGLPDFLAHGYVVF